MNGTTLGIGHFKNQMGQESRQTGAKQTHGQRHREEGYGPTVSGPAAHPSTCWTALPCLHASCLLAEILCQPPKPSYDIFFAAPALTAFPFTLAVQIQVIMAPTRPVRAPLTAPAAEILFQVMQKAIGGTAEPTMTPMNRYTQPRERPIFLQVQTQAAPTGCSQHTCAQARCSKCHRLHAVACCPHHKLPSSKLLLLPTE